MLDATPTAIVAASLSKFEAALSAGDLDRASAMFGDESYWRDLVAFTWNIKTMEGRVAIRDMLAACLKRTKPSGWRVADGEVAKQEGDGVVEAIIVFETAAARGEGDERCVGIREIVGNLLTFITKPLRRAATARSPAGAGAVRLFVA